MRLLHTSDLHLGQNFLGQSREAEHAAFLDWLVAQVQEHRVDALLVAGDVFDTGTPPSYAREQYNRFIVGIRDAGARLIVLGGNHDSPAMLAESRGLLARLDTLVVPTLMQSPAEHVYRIPGRDGAPGMILCAVPFIRSRDVSRSEAGQSAEDKRGAMMEGIAVHYARIHAAAVAMREASGEPLPIVASGHLTTVGASTSDSVREIYVGSLNAFPTSAFPPAAYIALGHIHQPQKVGGLEHIRYSGSPIPLSFDEVGQHKQVLLVELEGERLQSVTALPVPCFRVLGRVTGNLASLPAQLATVAAKVPQGELGWIEVTVETDDYLPDLQSRVAALVEALPLEVLRLRRKRSTVNAVIDAADGQHLDELQPRDVFAQRMAQEEDLPEKRVERLEACFDQVLAEIEGGESA
ncbi:exonuclease subunit SbcD [Lysobacter sp. A03]|uniref:exonuclease subunit SbcD n=1 Tax=Lysobacter sp. A03 TaxID=1199154 RepID=UPI0005B69BB3|nr:exonuclease subunit SbcD [Lysobacter sp. A03]KIQ95917.1 Exonuclease SbcD [Lysobacter sp. A03]